jgi:serine protease Do
VVASSKLDDLGLLKADMKPDAIASFRDHLKLMQGEAVVVYGYPLSGLLASSGNVSTGLITALAELRDDVRQMQISAPVQPGSSGGPLADMRGAVIGDALRVARLTDDIPQNINFAIKLSSVIDLMNANAVNYRAEASSQELSVAEIAQRMRAYTVRLQCN